jgi:oxygen-independent coproporphyrinogen-3 oxidase
MTISPHWTMLPPLSLYIHIPWCVRKCPYCDFNSHTAAKNFSEQESQYSKALIADLEIDLPFVQGRPLQSIFFGGGTPSLFSADSINYILTEIKTRIAFAPDIEITLEANPGTFEQEKFTGFYQAGINRLSIGVQSFNAHHLQHLGRIHSPTEAINAVAMAKKAGFINFNLDLMHGLPEQTVEQALADLKIAIELKPTHLSWYQLTIEPNTVFYSAPPVLPVDDMLGDIQEQGHILLMQHGFNQYEVSAYSQPHKQCAHNLNYWQFGDYLGIGAGAHGKITDRGAQHILRTWKTRLPADYLNSHKPFLAGTRILQSQELLFETLMNVLRLNEGIDLSTFCLRSGLTNENVITALQPSINNGFLQSNNRVQATAHGFRYLNSVLEHFL